MLRNTTLPGVVALALLAASPSGRAAQAAPLTLSPGQAAGVAELGRCLRAAHLNRVARERLSEYLSGKEALANFDDMARMQEFDGMLNAWVGELVQAFGEDQILPRMPPDREADKAFLGQGSSTEAQARAMVAATAREANVCLADTARLRKALAAP